MNVGKWRLGCCTALLLSATSCITSSGSSAGTVYPTTITVRPLDFKGNVTCGVVTGSWQTYVVTLTDQTDPAHPSFSSMPVLCSMPVAFEAVVPGHAYLAEIDAYDRSDIVPHGSPVTGNRHVVDPGTGEDVLPHWQSRCPSAAQGEGGLSSNGELAVPEANTTVFVRDCSALAEVEPPHSSGIQVDLSAIRQQTACGSEPGQIDHYEVIPLGEGLARQQVACEKSVVFQPVVPGQTYSFHIDAFEKGVEAHRWGAQCTAIPLAGVVLPATCDSLTELGAVSVPISSFLASAGRVCSLEDVVSYQALLVGVSTSSDSTPCQLGIVFQELLAATYQVVVSARNQAGQTLATGYCEAAVEPGRTAIASCLVQ